MKNMTTRFAATVVAISTLLTSPIRAEERPAFLQFVRPLGMGGAFTAVADDHNVFSFNPAGMVQRTGGQFTLFDIAVGGSKDLKEAYDFISDNEEDLKNFQDLSAADQQELINEIDNTISKLDPRATLGADIASYVSGPTFLGMPFHVGFGGFAVTDARFRMDSGVIVPFISYEVNNDIVLPLSIAKRWEAPWRIPGKFGIGITGKYIRRDQIKENHLSVTQLEDFETPPLQTGTGIGSDLGFLYQPSTRFSFGIMVQDFLGTKIKYDATAAEKGYVARPERETVIRPRTNVGIAMMPNKLLWLIPTGERWTFSADVRDIFAKNEHLVFENGMHRVAGQDLWTHLHLGTEFRYWFFRFRGGAYQGYPSLGLGLDIPVFKIDYAFYSTELGAHAGDRREENHAISLAMRFGSGHTESRDRIKKLKESKSHKDVSTPEVESGPSSTPASTTTEGATAPAPSAPGSDLPH